MSNKLGFSEKNLKDWAGWRVFRDGKALFSRGVVEKVVREDSVVRGQLSLGPRGLRSGFKIPAPGGYPDNLCPCRDNQDRGLICSHLVAMGLELIRQECESEKSDQDLDQQDRLDQIGRSLLPLCMYT